MTSIANIMMNATSFSIKNHLWYCRLIRWGIMSAFILAWPYLIELIGKKTNMPVDVMTRWKTERIRIAIWLIVFDLLIAENLIFRLMNAG